MSNYKKLEEVIKRQQETCPHMYYELVTDNSEYYTDDPSSIQEIYVCKVCDKVLGVFENEC
jgi:hypothetical protein